MTLKQVEYLPERACADYKRLDEFFKMFMKMNVKYAQVQFEDYEYATEATCRGSLHSYIMRNPDLPVVARVISSNVYLVRTDMED